MTCSPFIVESAVDARTSDPQPAGDFRGPDVLGLQPHDVICVPASSWRTALIAVLSLGLRDSFSLSFKHGFAFSLSNGANHGQHKPPRSGRGVQWLTARHRQYAE